MPVAYDHAADTRISEIVDTSVSIERGGFVPANASLTSLAHGPIGWADEEVLHAIDNR